MFRRRSTTAATMAGLGLLVLAGCGGDDERDRSAATLTAEDVATASSTDDDGVEPVGAGDEEGETGEQQYPDVVDVVAEQDGDGTWTFDVTISSPYDTPERYADAWRVLGPDGTELGVRELLHDHADEQPFTRSLDGVEVPEDVDEVTIEGRDQANGWGGETMTIALDRG